MTMLDLLTLGPIHVSDFLAPDEEVRHEPVELRLQMDSHSGLVRLKDVVDPDFMYGRYWYRSGINPSMRADLADVVESVRKVQPLEDRDVWLDIACNDGTLLSLVPENLYRIGIDPADDTFTAESTKHADVIVQDYFSAATYPSAHRATVVTCIAMFYDLPDPADFLADVHKVMTDDGVFVIQASYTPLMLEQLAFDNICHEHACYYTLYTLKTVLAAAGFQVVDCQLNTTNGGSFRVFAMKESADTSRFGTQPHRDVARMRVKSLLDHERVQGYNHPPIWREFAHRLDLLKKHTVDYLRTAVAAGKTVAAYGASTKGNTLLPYFGLDSTIISYAVERSEAKFGLRTVGTNIPIISEDEMRTDPPDIMLMLPWCFQAEMIQRERDYLLAGGTFVIPCPVFRIVTGADVL